VVHSATVLMMESQFKGVSFLHSTVGWQTKKTEVQLGFSCTLASVRQVPHLP